MPLASRLGKYIDVNAIQCQLVHHARSRDLSHAVLLAGAVPESTLRAHLIVDHAGPAVLVVPFQSKTNIDALNHYSGRSFQIIDDERAGKLFADCDNGHIPLFAQAYNLPVYVDEKVLTLDVAFASSGCASSLIKMSGASMRSVFKHSNKGLFSKTLMEPERVLCVNKEYSLDDVARKLTKLYRLPPMPETAIRILHLTSDPESTIDDLAQLVEHDPSLSAQIMRYARSALFNYRGNLTCVREAINVVLGFDRVARLSMGIASARAFRVPAEGPLGLDAMWKHALHCGVLCQALAVMAKPSLDIDDREAYLSGLLHNFGLLLVGQLFPPEYRLLNKLREAEPERSMSEIEGQVFGMGAAQEFISLGHGSIGAILLKLWGLPEACVKVSAMHQQLNYQGEHESQVGIVQLANHLLAQYGIGDEPSSVDAGRLYKQLGIDEHQALALAELTVQQCATLDDMTRALVA